MPNILTPSLSNTRWRMTLGAAALCALLPVLAQADTSVKVTHMTSFHYGGENETSQDGSAKGWPNIRYPSSPPLMATHPASGRAFLFGGSNGADYGFIKSVGLWWMPASPGHYERLQTSANKIFGQIPGTPIQSASGHIYGLIVSQFADTYPNFADDGIDCTGEKMAQCLEKTESFQRDGRTYSYFTSNHSGLVGKGLLFRTDFDGTNLQIIESSMGQLNIPNGVLILDTEENLYGLDLGPSGNGRIFKFDASGGFHSLYEFGLAPNGKPQVPNGMILGSDGKLYGVTAYPRGLPMHPDTPTSPDTPVGAIFSIDPASPTPANTFKVLHTITLAEGEINSDPARHTPQHIGLNWLVEGGDGWLYGTTSLPTCRYWGHDYRPLQGFDRHLEMETPLCGSQTIYETDEDSDFSALYDGPMPHGAAYRISKDGSSGLQILHAFSYTDGSTPRGPMALGQDGLIYGTTISGGANRQWLDTTGLRSGIPRYGKVSQEKPPRRTCEYFRGNGIPYSACQEYEASGLPGLYRQLYETMYARNGALYRITPGNISVDSNGKVTQSGFELVHSFRHEVDGRRPLGVAAGADGRLYGTTLSGGRGFVTGRNVTWHSDDNGTAFMADLAGNTPDADITLTFTPSEISLGDKTTVTWTSFQARDCVASWRTDSQGNWQAVPDSDSEELSPPSGTYFHTLQCIDAVKGGQIATTATLYVNAPVAGRDGNHTEYGNGGGGGSLPWELPLLLAPALLTRRRQA